MPLDKLPVEIIHRIFNELDVETILLNVRYVCKRLYATTNSYNRYKIDFYSSSMKNFNVICKIIEPSKIPELILPNDEKTFGLMEKFLSKFNLEQFKNLEKLTMTHIDDEELEISLRQIRDLRLKELSIIRFDLHDRKTLKYELFTPVLTNPTLRRLNLEFRFAEAKDLPWPRIQSNIVHLRIGSIIKFDQYYTILEQLPFLKTLILKDCEFANVEPFAVRSFQQVKSLTFEKCQMSLDEFEVIVSCVQELEHIKLVSKSQLLNGSRLELIFSGYLYSLKKIELYFDSMKKPNYENDFIGSFQSFSTPFWTDEKKCYINCDYIDFHGDVSIRLYSLPLCISRFEYYSNDYRKTLSTVPGHFGNKRQMDFVKELSVHFQQLSNGHHRQRNMRSSILFNNVTELKLTVDENWSIVLFEPLSQLVNFFKLEVMFITVEEHSQVTENLYRSVKSLLSETPNVKTFSFMHGASPHSTRIILENLIEIVPPSIRHFHAMVKSYEDIQLIINKLQHLSSIKTQIIRVMARFYSENRRSITDIRPGTTCFKLDPNLQLWLGMQNADY